MVGPKRKPAESGLEAPRKKTKPTEKPAPSRPVRPQAEPEFIRGGGGALTQQERKKIASKAAQDILFEQEGGGALPAADSDSDADAPVAPQTATTKRKRRQPESKSKHTKKDDPVYEDRVVPEGLNPKKLKPGAKVLGQISEVRKGEIVLSLPNSLTGYIPITAISNGLDRRIADLMRDDSSEGSEDDEDIDLKMMFRPGQYLRAAVTTAEETNDTHTRKKRMDLSIHPSVANQGFLKSEISVHATVQVEVLSVEDHGLVVDLGLDEPDVRGFISLKELPNKSTDGIQTGAVLLCIVTGLGSNGKVIKLSPDPRKLGSVSTGSLVKSAPGIGVLVPGTAAEFIVSSANAFGIVGKVFGLVDVTVDIVHSGGLFSHETDLSDSFSVGSRHHGRVIWTSKSEDRMRVGMSLLPHVLDLSSPTGASSLPVLDFKPSQIIEEAEIIAVDSKLGVVMNVGSEVASAFVHISRLSDERIESPSATSGPYKVGTKHKCRLLSYNYIDQLYQASLAAKTIALPFLQLEDLSEGDQVRGTVDRLTNPTSASTGLLLQLTDAVMGFVPALHLSDVLLSHPEKKFRAGVSVTARVLSVDLEKRGLKLTLKKSLVNSDAPIWNSYDSVSVGASAPGTIIKFVPTGAVIQFYGQLQGLLPLSQMSETYIADPEQQFRLGQVITVRVLSLDRAKNRLILTCRGVEDFGPEQQKALEELVLGNHVQGKVAEKTRTEIVLDLTDVNLKAILPFEHLVDGSETAAEEAAKRIHLGQTIKQLMIRKKDFSRGRLEVTKKPSLLKAMAAGKFPARFEDLAEGMQINASVGNVSEHGVFVAFLGDLTALLPRSGFDATVRSLPNFGFRANQSVTAFVQHLDSESRRITLSLQKPDGKSSVGGDARHDDRRVVSNAVDGVTKSFSEFSIGKLTSAKVTAVKETQLNVLLADGVPGRIDVSETFDDWSEIKDKKHPLKQFHVDQTIPVRILGTHDSKTHRFLPFSHTGKARVFELSAKTKTSKADLAALDEVRSGSKWVCFVNNVTDHGLWVNLSPHVRGRIPPMDVSEDAAVYSDLHNNFPVGCALQAKVTRVDPIANKLELSSRPGGHHGPASISNLSVGSVLPAAVTKITPESVIVQLSETVSAPIHLADLADDYDKASPEDYEKGSVIPVCVLKVDEVKNKLRLSARPSKVDSSSSSVVDREVLHLTDLKINDICRGFVKNVANNGVFVALAPDVSALVKIADISDAFIKDWSAGFQPNQIVRGKIISVETALNRVHMSLKESVLNKEYKPLTTYTDVHVGDLIKGKIRKVEDFGVFIVLDNSSNVSGLCHRSEIADGKVSQIRSLYDEGDAVQAVVLKVDTSQRRISFSMKASRVEAAKSTVIDVSDEELEDVDGGVPLPEESAQLSDSEDDDSIAMDVSAPQKLSTAGGTGGLLAGLSGGGFSWAVPSMDDGANRAQDSDSDSDAKPAKKPKRKKHEPVVDRTADLDAHGPQSGADFERLLLGQPNASILWIQYMAFELQQGEVDKARAIAERAVRSVNHQTPETEAEAMNAWVAYLNLENTYGTEESLEAMFERACEYNDPEDMHSKLASIYIQSGKIEKADELLQTMIKKFSMNPKVWINYAHFLFDVVGSPDRGRELLPKALQSLPGHQHVELTSKFAQLEFRLKNGQAERGRTIFEGLFSNFPRRLDLWNVLLDLEIKTSDREHVRKLFERIIARNLKASKAHKFFTKWAAYEEKHGDKKSQERVQAKAREYVKTQQRAKE